MNRTEERAKRQPRVNRPRVRPKAHALEQAYQRVTGQARPYWEIALELWREIGSAWRACEVIRDRYGVEVTGCTVSQWVNLGYQRAKEAGEAQ